MRMIIICIDGDRASVSSTGRPGGIIMRTRQDIWLDWATGILVALGIVAIVAGSALIAWMSWQST
jgi:hypothetical protein